MISLTHSKAESKTQLAGSSVAAARPVPSSSKEIGEYGYPPAQTLPVTRRVRMVIGITSDQTCLVLKGRLAALRNAGFEITLVASPGRLLSKTATAEGVKAWPVRMAREIDLLPDLAALLKLCWILLRIRPAITDFSTPKAGLLGNLAAWLTGVPHRVYTLRGLKLERTAGSKKKLLLLSEKVAAWCSHVVLCNSDSLEQKAIDLHVAPAYKTRVLGSGSSNGVDLNRFGPGPTPIRELLGIAEKDKIVGFVGRLTNDKGVPELLEAFEQILLKIPDCCLMLVGWFDQAEDKLSARWRSHIASHPRIRLIGYVDDPLDYYRAMDLLVLPTHREGFPNVVLEAASCGVPVITTESTGARDSVISEITGLLIQPGNSIVIAEAALELLENPARCKRMGIAARAWVEEKFSEQQVLGLAVHFYHELIENGPL